MINYYPAYHSWGAMWLDWDPELIQTDFARLTAMGANAVRLVLQTNAFGYPAPSSVMVQRLAQAVALASNNHLKVELTLFDGWSSYTDLAGSHAWAKNILGSYQADPRIVLVEIQNEINPYNKSAMAWAKNMIPFVRSVSKVPVTVSAAGDINYFYPFVQALGSTRPDVFSYHFYSDDPSTALSTLYWAQRMAAPTPLFVGETGMSTGSTDGPSDPALESQQDQFLRSVESATQYLALPAAAPWTLWDFAPGTCWCSPAKEYHYGLLRLDGSPKPAFATVEQFFKTGVIPS